MPIHYDVIIVGTGAEGGTLACRLAPSGKRILLLERGGYVGGNTKVYRAALLRFRREDFGEVKHYGGISPEWSLHYEIPSVLHGGRASQARARRAWDRSDRATGQRAVPLSGLPL